MVGDTRTAELPAGFIFGTATASYQIEGSVAADGRGPSIWDTFSHSAGTTRNGDTGDVACDHYRRMDDDLDLIAELGAPAYRFSVAWPRVQPTGKGPANTEGLDFYRRLVAGLRERAIAPVATLYHWDLPQPLEDAGGWVERDTTERFAEYASIVAAALGDDVEMWITLNEPWCSAWLGYGNGRHAPGLRDLGKAAAATHHLLLAHGEAVSALRAAISDASVGISLNLAEIRPGSDDEADVDAARRLEGNHNRIFLDPLFSGRYPEDMLEHYAAHTPGFSVVRDADLPIIAQPIDFLGINFYTPSTVIDVSRVDAANAAGYCVPEPEPDLIAENLRTRGVARPEYQQSEMGWEIEPGALRDLLCRVGSEYTSLPLYVTENGGAFDDYVDPEGRIHDRRRISYIDAHLRAVADAIAEGTDVQGYFAWSLLDNFEWGHGYSKRFGLVWVDYPSGTRLRKDSFAWYRHVATSGHLGDPPEEP